MSVEPLETPLGRKRTINQSSCNKDFSCTQGFCPSFVEIDAPVQRKPDSARVANAEADLLAKLPEPDIKRLTAIQNFYVTGIGGLGVLTLGALLGKAAELDGLSSTVLDFTGLAQKNGAVVSHVRIGPASMPIHAVRIPDGLTDVLLAADALVAADSGNLLKLSPSRTAGVINTDEAPTAANVEDPDFQVPTAESLRRIADRTRAEKSHTLGLTRLAEKVFGNSIAGNIMLLGYAWQKGLVPIRRDALVQAIEANGAAVAMNKRAFEWGRAAAHDLDAVQAVVDPGFRKAPEAAWTAARFAEELTAYQDAAYADRYLALVGEVSRARARLGPVADEFVRLVEKNAYKVMAYKDEYEVARLYASDDYKQALASQFSDWKSVHVWLAPPTLTLFGPSRKIPKKRKFGSWVFSLFSVLERMKRLRGTAFDPFGFTDERRSERKLRDDYLTMIGEVARKLTAERLPLAEQLAALPQDIRGFGHVKDKAMLAARERWTVLQQHFELSQTAD
jgi:indolepyruvate ferredoxin oxidoreductase